MASGSGSHGHGGHGGGHGGHHHHGHGYGGYGHGHGYGHGGFPQWGGMMPPMYGYGPMGMPQSFGMMPSFYGGYGNYGCPFMMHQGGMAAHTAATHSAATHSTAKKCCDDCTCDCCTKGCKCTGDAKCECTCGCCKDGCCAKKGDSAHQCPYLHGMQQCPFMTHHGGMSQTPASCCPRGKKCCDDCTCDCCTKGCKCTGDAKCECTCGCCKDGCCAKKGDNAHQCPYLHGGMQGRGHCPGMYGMHPGFMMPHSMMYPHAPPMMGHPRGCCGGEKKCC